MSRIVLRTTLAALVIGPAALGAVVAPSAASAKGFGGGGFHGGGFHGGLHGGHWGGHRGYGWGRGYGAYDDGACYVKRIIDEDGDILLRKICY